ncbi:hypothetical protein BAUCODRAFT_250252 [Baudoinia panamericana UAMH 10762]|uniref:Uncharacterized protein n=1 Tax=Baudoinia panamericana (strain UAMH 10762) TaxID=717646 RepID=M2MQB5_BAUPA|nr:uncharacterized protein BAUCODRAFT_250252 [Baudoinia panamericana UAMH 10762]EMC93668.1 hypothetical protein BAUCODRAFT_250252 [Baudoinia panamericana UAMH 10762]
MAGSAQRHVTNAMLQNTMSMVDSKQLCWVDVSNPKEAAKKVRARSARRGHDSRSRKNHDREAVLRRTAAHRKSQSMSSTTPQPAAPPIVTGITSPSQSTLSRTETEARDMVKTNSSSTSSPRRNSSWLDTVLGEPSDDGAAAAQSRNEQQLHASAPTLVIARGASTASGANEYKACGAHCTASSGAWPIRSQVTQPSLTQVG